MKKAIVFLFGLFAVHAASAQFVARMEVKGPLPGACDSTNVYALIPGFTGQVAPTPGLTKKQIEDLLNKEVKFLADNPKFKGEMMINCIINCSGEMIRCEVDNRSGNDELDAQILAVFKKLTKWTPGVLNGKAVDAVELFSIEIKKGKITIS
jgi:TonB family protein